MQEEIFALTATNYEEVYTILQNGMEKNGARSAMIPYMVKFIHWQNMTENCMRGAILISIKIRVGPILQNRMVTVGKRLEIELTEK